MQSQYLSDSQNSKKAFSSVQTVGGDVSFTPTAWVAILLNLLVNGLDFGDMADRNSHFSKLSAGQ